MNSKEDKTLVLLDDDMNIVGAYKCSGQIVLMSFLSLVQFIGFDKYYLVPEELNR